MAGRRPACDTTAGMVPRDLAAGVDHLAHREAGAIARLKIWCVPVRRERARADARREVHHVDVIPMAVPSSVG